MQIQSFLTATLDELALVSGLDKTRWSKYFGGKRISEKTLEKLSDTLEMPMADLYLAISLRRQRAEKRGRKPSVKSYKKVTD